MSKREAYILARMFYRLGEQIERAFHTGRHEDGCALCQIVGRLEVLIFGFESYRFQCGSTREAA